MRHIVTPTREALQMAVELVKSGKYVEQPVIVVAAMLDGYLSGIITTDISFDKNGTPVVNIREDKGPEDADEGGRDESPTDEELQKYGCPQLVESRAIRFLCNLPDAELERISDHDFSGIKFMLARLARDEVKRRRDA